MFEVVSKMKRTMMTRSPYIYSYRWCPRLHGSRGEIFPDSTLFITFTFWIRHRNVSQKRFTPRIAIGTMKVTSRTCKTFGTGEKLKFSPKQRKTSNVLVSPFHVWQIDVQGSWPQLLAMGKSNINLFKNGKKVKIHPTHIINPGNGSSKRSGGPGSPLWDPHQCTAGKKYVGGNNMASS